MFEETVGKVIAAVVSALSAGFFWIVRTVFTNQQQVKILQHSLDSLRESNEHQSELLRQQLLSLERLQEQRLNAAMEKAHMNHEMLKAVLEKKND